MIPSECSVCLSQFVRPPFLTYVSTAHLVSLPPHFRDGHLLAFDEVAAWTSPKRTMTARSLLIASGLSSERRMEACRMINFITTS
jgi:hypothetical protein